ncbi:hypothetical protein DITRI_Ditri16bG0008400 [Diplodiscus trichospermus]
MEAPRNFSYSTALIALVTLFLIAFIIYTCFRPCSNGSEPKQSTLSAADVELGSIPVHVYGSESSPPSLLATSNCAICLEDYVAGDRVRVLPRCKHMFHKSCIEEWLQVPSLHCPICRDRVLEHCLQSAESNNCRNIQRNRTAHPFPSLAFSFGGIHTSSPSVITIFS